MVNVIDDETLRKLENGDVIEIELGGMVVYLATEKWAEKMEKVNSLCGCAKMQCDKCIHWEDYDCCHKCFKSASRSERKKYVAMLTNAGYYVWQIADKFGISEAEVVKLQGGIK